MLHHQGVIDALLAHLVEEKNFRSVNVLMAASREWNLLLGDGVANKIFEEVCADVQSSCDAFAKGIIDLQHKSAELTEGSRYDMRRTIRDDLVKIASNTNCLLTSLRRSGFAKEMARCVARCLHALARQRRSTLFLTQYGAPIVTPTFLKAASTKLCCAAHCNRNVKMRVVVNEKFEFEVSSRRKYVDFSSVECERRKEWIDMMNGARRANGVGDGFVGSR